MSSIAYVPKVPQGQLGGMTAGFSARYTCEKYFKSICAVVGEVNLTQMGWQEKILDRDDQPVFLHTDETQTLKYARKMKYVQIPVMARMWWGRERKGLQAFFQIGIILGQSGFVVITGVINQHQLFHSTAQCPGRLHDCFCGASFNIAPAGANINHRGLGYAAELG